ncbi:probable asparagine--tRNA ligase, mitochondrial, partial [Cryptotermes secundus]
GLSKGYTFGPTFRAENSRSRIHLAEFYVVKSETAFIESLEELMKVMENLIKDVTSKVLGKCTDDVQTLCSAAGNEDSLLSVLEKPFEVMTHEEAVDIIDGNSGNFVSLVERGQGFGKEHELYPVKHAGGCSVFVVDWPHDIKPFYMK